MTWTREKYNAYMKRYMLERYHKRMASFKVFLGGKCTSCGSIENLELDHIDRCDKALNISNVWSYSERKYHEELKKCQLLCYKCHKKKTLVDMGMLDARLNHGTVSSYRYCRCNECRTAWNLHSKLYKRKKARIRRIKKILLRQL